MEKRKTRQQQDQPGMVLRQEERVYQVVQFACWLNSNKEDKECLFIFWRQVLEVVLTNIGQFLQVPHCHDSTYSVGIESFELD